MVQKVLELRLPTMDGEISETCLSQMAKNGVKLSIMVRENFDTSLLQMYKNEAKLSTIVGENFKSSLFQMDTISSSEVAQNANNTFPDL